MSLKTFASEALSNLNTTAAIVPSSRFLARAMLRPLRLRQAKVVVEFGPGTGVMTEALLQKMAPDARLLAFEINPRFSNYLQEQISDPRFLLVNDCAETLGQTLREQGLDRVDAVVSSLGLTIMPENVRTDIFDTLMPFLSDDAALTQFQYLHGFVLNSQVDIEKLRRYSTDRFLQRYFGSVTQQVVWPNIPPAVVFTCRR